MSLTRIGESEVLDKLETFLEAGEDGELAFERVLAKEEIKNGMVVLLRLPVGVGHRELVQVREQGLNSITQLQVAFEAVVAGPSRFRRLGCRHFVS